MDQAAGWLPDPEREGEERYWSGCAWTDHVRPAGKSVTLRLPEHVADLQRALAASTADIDAVEDRLSTLFKRAERPNAPGTRRAPGAPRAPGANGTAGANGTRGRAARRNGNECESGFERELYLDIEVDDPEDDDLSDGIGARSDGIGAADVAVPPADQAGEAVLDWADGVDEAFADLDAALAAEEPEQVGEPPSPPEPGGKKGLFRRRS